MLKYMKLESVWIFIPSLIQHNLDSVSFGSLHLLAQFIDLPAQL